MASIKGSSFGNPNSETEINKVADLNNFTLDDCSESFHYKEELSQKKRKQGNIQKKSLKESLLLLKRNQEKCTERAIKNLSNDLSFGEKVVGERSPQNESFSKNKNIRKRLETSIDQHKVKNRKPHSSYYNNRHMPCHLQPIESFDSQQQQQPKQQQPNIQSVEIKESFCLGINDSLGRLTRIPIEEFQNNNNICQEKSKKALKATASTGGWEEHVLSLISESTANIIVKDYTTINQTTLKKFIDKRNKKSSPIPTEVSTLISNIEINNVGATIKQEEQTIKDKKIDQSLVFTELTPNSKKAPKEFKTMLQKSYPLPPEKWSTKAETKSKMMSKRGIQKWADYPVEIKVEIIFTSLFL